MSSKKNSRKPAKNTGNTTRRFVGHTKDVLSVAFSVDNRQVCCLRHAQTWLSHL